MTSNETILKINNLIKEYDSFRAVDNISFNIKPGEIVGLLGPNGAGKTTTINMILGILEPTGGTIEMLDKDIKKYRSEVSESINFAAVYASVPPNLTVYQNLYVFGLLYKIKNLKDILFCIAYYENLVFHLPVCRLIFSFIS